MKQTHTRNIQCKPAMILRSWKLERIR